MENKTYWPGHTDYAKTLKPWVRIGGLDLPEIRKRYTSSWEEEEEDAHVCACGIPVRSNTHWK